MLKGLKNGKKKKKQKRLHLRIRNPKGLAEDQFRNATSRGGAHQRRTGDVFGSRKRVVVVAVPVQ
jgi:hypothetical protein